MKGPAIAQTTCPGCGAPIRIDVWSQVHKCQFCGQSSFVHRPNQPVLPPPPGQESFRHIHVSSAAVNKSVAMIVVFAVVGFNVLGGIITAIVLGLGAISATVTSIPAGPTMTITTPAQPGPGPLNVPSQAQGAACQKAVRCCKAIQPGSPGCDMMGMLGEAECVKQAKALEDGARAMGKRCD
jgi:hypothetical protein